MLDQFADSLRSSFLYIDRLMKIYRTNHRSSLPAMTLAAFLLLLSSASRAQLVCLPAPRLLTLMPMGGQAGTDIAIELTGEHLEDVGKMIFSHPKITAKPVLDAKGEPVENKFTVTIAADVPEGIYDARVVSRLGISSPRAFSVSRLPDTVASGGNTSLEKGRALELNSVCNAVMSPRAVDYYTFPAKAGQRISVECAAEGIDSKLTPVLIIADKEGRDLLVNRTGGVIEFLPPGDGTYVIKVSDLTYQGSKRHFYRLVLREVAPGKPLPRHSATRRISSMSWPPPGLSEHPAITENEPVDGPEKPMPVTLPCDIGGSFYPAADVDTFQFTAKKGETWWIEAASERLGLPTDPFVLVQKIEEKDGKESFVDVAELHDIKPPIKVSSNGYSYDGPPYDAGSPDVLGKLEIKEDGDYLLQIRDLFGGTRNDPRNVYRLIVRRAQPDFALAAWAVHMTLRNGDRAAFSKPMALRAGASMVLEVAVIRRDGFDGEIQLEVEGLPAGVTAAGLRIPSGKTVGHVILTAGEDADSSVSLATIRGKATIGEKVVTRPCLLGTMEWPVRDAKQEIPAPRLVGDIPVSVTSAEKASLSLAAAEPDKIYQAAAGEKLKIPIQAIWREDFSGTSVKLKTYGAGFEKNKEFELPLQAKSHTAEIDLAALKTKPGEYTIAFYGGAVTRYRYHPEAAEKAKTEQKKAEDEAAALAGESKKLAEAAKNAEPGQKESAEKAAREAAEKLKAAEKNKTTAAAKAKAAARVAAAKDIVDIVVSKPIRIRVVEPKEKSTGP